MQLLVEAVHEAMKFEVAQKGLTFVEVQDVVSTEISGGEVTVALKLRMHTVKQGEAFSGTEVREFTHTATDKQEELTDEELLREYKSTLNRLATKMYTYNLVTGQSAELKNMPAKTPFVTYVGEIDIRIPSAVYTGLNKVPKDHQAMMQYVENVVSEFAKKDKEYMRKIVNVVDKKNGKTFMRENGFTLLSMGGSPVQYWTKNSVYQGAKIKIYATPFFGVFLMENGGMHTLFNRFAKTLEQNIEYVGKMPLPDADVKALARLIDMTHLRKK